MLLNDDRLNSNNSPIMISNKDINNMNNKTNNPCLVYGSNLKNKSLSSSISSSSSSASSSSASAGQINTSNVYQDSSLQHKPKAFQTLTHYDSSRPFQPTTIKQMSASPQFNNHIYRNNSKSSSSHMINHNIDQNSTNKINTLSDRYLANQIRMNSNNFPLNTNMSTSYTYQTYNPNRMSSYDNENLQNYQHIYENTTLNEKLPTYLLNTGNFSRKRSSIACGTNNQDQYQLNQHKPVTNQNLLNRAINYARKTSTNSAISLSSSANNKTSWKTKIGKYLTQANSIKKSIKSNEQEGGCDIIMDEDIYSSYHLTRKIPINNDLIKNSTQTNSNSQKNTLISSSSTSSASSSSSSPRNSSTNQIYDLTKTNHNKTNKNTIQSNLTNSLNKLTITNGFNSLRKMFKIPSRSSSKQNLTKTQSESTKRNENTNKNPNSLLNSNNEHVTTTMTLNRQAKKGGRQIKKQMSFSTPSYSQTDLKSNQTSEYDQNQRKSSMFKIYKNVLRKLNKSPINSNSIIMSSTRNDSIVATKPQTTLNNTSSCLNHLNSKSLFYNQLNCVGNDCNQHESSSSSVFNALNNNFLSSSPINEIENRNNFIDDEETIFKNKVKLYDGYKSLIKQIESHKPISQIDTNNQLLNNNSIQNNELKTNDDQEEDLICDLEVASFFERNKIKTPILNLDVDDDSYYMNEFQNYDCGYFDFNSTCNYANTNNNNKNINFDEDAQNLDYLVRQLVAEASLSNLNFNLSNKKCLNLHSTGQNYEIFSNLDNEDYIDDEFEDEQSKNSLDLEHSEYVDDHVNFNSNSGEEESLTKSDLSENSLVDVDACYLNKKMKNLHSFDKIKKLNENKDLESFRKYERGVNLNAKNYKQTNHVENMIGLNPIKIEKKIKLNYRRPQNFDNLLNFGTLC